MRSDLALRAHITGLLILLFSSVQAMALDLRVFRGVAVDSDKNAWQVAIHVAGASGPLGFRCSGTHIAPGWILTAAHCLRDRRTGRYIPDQRISVTFGSVMLNVPRKRLPVIQSFPYKPSNLWTNDIALLRVEAFPGPLITIDHPIPLPSAPEPLTVSGWGKTETLQISPSLRAAKVVQLSRKHCALPANLEAFLTEQTVCAGSGGLDGADTCEGDSGGPLYDEVGLEARQFAITTGGGECGGTGVYTLIKPYLPWISQTIAHSASGRH